MFGLLHSNADWVFAAIIATVGVCVLLFKIFIARDIFGSVAGIMFWIFIFWLHAKGGGASTQGIMTATFSALLFDAVGFPILKILARIKS